MELSNHIMNRRKFLITTCCVLAASAIACSQVGLTTDKPKIQSNQITKGLINMNKRILVTYATRAGSTAEIATAIGKSITDLGYQTDVLPMTEVKSIAGYQAIVAGSAIQGGKWLPEGLDFLKANRNHLKQVPFSAFMVCITLGLKDADKYREGIKSWMEPVRSIVRPTSEGYFAGALDFDKVPFNLNAIGLRAAVKLGALPEGDHRDWKSIHSWAESLKQIL